MLKIAIVNDTGSKVVELTEAEEAGTESILLSDITSKDPGVALISKTPMLPNCDLHQTSLGIFDDIGIDTKITENNRLRLLLLENALDILIPDDCLSYPIVDIGCCSGHILRYLWHRGARNLTGMEPRREHLAVARQWCEKDGADINWVHKPAEKVQPKELDGAILLSLGLIYHLQKPVEFFDMIAESNLRYGVVEAQVIAEASFGLEAYSLVNSISSDPVWNPSKESVEEILDNHFSWECLPRTSYLASSRAVGSNRYIWKFWK